MPKMCLWLKFPVSQELWSCSGLQGCSRCSQSTFARTCSDISTNILLALVPARPSVAFLQGRQT